MGESGPNVHTIPSGASFLDALARGIVARYNDPSDPLALSRITVLLPTRRAVRALAQAFTEVLGGTVILPSVRPIGDVDEDIFALADEPAIQNTSDVLIPPAMSQVRRTLLIMDRFRRKFLLSRLVQAWLESSGSSDSVVLATELAQSLSELLDTLQTENVSLEKLPDLVPDRFADHWRQSLEFLNILRQVWPEILEEEGAIDPGDRRNRLLMALKESWANHPPTDPVIAAGSTGSIPATAELLKVIAQLPHGHVVLPGLDLEMRSSVWDQLEQGHPQEGMCRLLKHVGADREDVTPWDDQLLPQEQGVRTRILNRALSPWQATGHWQDIKRSIGALKPELSAALADIHRIDASHPGEEAGAIALLMRQTLETPDKTAALVTPDRGLARRVSAELRRWHIDVNDSAGRPLVNTALFSFLRLLMRSVETDFDAVAFLSLLKNPFAASGYGTAEFRSLARSLERHVLRGPTIGAGLEGLQEAAEKRAPDDVKQMLQAYLAKLAEIFTPVVDLFDRDDVPFVDLVAAHIQAAEHLAATTDEDGAARLWAGDDGEAAALFANEMLEHGTVLGDIEPLQYLGLFEALARGRVVRGSHSLHPRLYIWGPLEARLQRTDVTILGGLNEGTWPMEADVDPWLSRPMRADLGLSAPEQRIGLSAHDFVQGASAPIVYLTRSEKVDGTPTVPSRWLLRLDTLLKGLGLEGSLRTDSQPLSLYRALQQTSQPDRPFQFAPLPMPRPAPPVEARPRELSVTQIETLIRDPYAIYARHILRLKPLDPIGAEAGALERGILIHDILNTFIRLYTDELPDDAAQILLEIGRDYFDRSVEGPAVEAFWWPRFASFVQWFVPYERQRREEGRAPEVTEVLGRLQFELPGGAFTLTARADRLDMVSGAGLEIIDYKTGAVPSGKQVLSGLSPQLTLEAGIARDGGFEGLAKRDIAALTYIRISGGQQGGVATSFTEEVDQLVVQSVQGAQRLLAAYDAQSMPYLPRLRPFRDDVSGPYDHLARVKEWQSSDLGDEA